MGNDPRPLGQSVIQRMDLPEKYQAAILLRADPMLLRRYPLARDW